MTDVPTPKRFKPSEKVYTKSELLRPLIKREELADYVAYTKLVAPKSKKHTEVFHLVRAMERREVSVRFEHRWVAASDLRGSKELVEMIQTFLGRWSAQTKVGLDPEDECKGAVMKLKWQGQEREWRGVLKDGVLDLFSS